MMKFGFVNGMTGTIWTAENKNDTSLRLHENEGYSCIYICKYQLILYIFIFIAIVNFFLVKKIESALVNG